MSSFLTPLLYVLSVITSLFLIFLVLIQRGKGGGLAGAFGGVGGSSAFGTKAGDVFTRVTIYTALTWFVLNMFLVYRMNRGRESAFGPAEARTKSTAPKDAGKGGKSDPKAGDDAAGDKDLLPPIPGTDGLPSPLQGMDREPAAPTPLPVPDVPATKGKAATPAPATTPAPAPAAPNDELPSDPFDNKAPAPAPKAADSKAP